VAHQPIRESWWQGCRRARAALLSGAAESPEVKRTLRLCLTLAVTGCAMVVTALVGLFVW
jgi:hypothetical protein